MKMKSIVCIVCVFLLVSMIPASCAITVSKNKEEKNDSIKNSIVDNDKLFFTHLPYKQISLENRDIKFTSWSKTTSHPTVLYTGEDHDRININSDSDFKFPTKTSGVVSGSGTENDPYIIEGWVIKVEPRAFRNVGILISNTKSHVVIRDVTIEHVDIDGLIYSFGIWLINAKNVIIENCNVINTGNGISCEKGSTCIIRDNLVVGYPVENEDGTITWPSAMGIYAGQGSAHCYTEVNIYSNTIIGTGQAITCSYKINAIIQNNTLQPSGHGLVCASDHKDTNIVISHNNIDGTKTVQSEPPICYSCNGMIFGGGCNLVVEHNIINSWLKGMYILVWDESSPANNCHVHYNNFIDNYYAIHNRNDPIPVNATNNWWGSSEGPGRDEIGPRNPVKGDIDYLPYLTEPESNAGRTLELPPNKADLDGPTTGKLDEELTFTTSAIDDGGQEVHYMFFWGDGTYSYWQGPYASGEKVTATHTYTTNDKYPIKVLAKNSNGCVSEWSDTLSVTISKNKSTKLFQLHLIQRILCHLPLLEQLLQCHLF